MWKFLKIHQFLSLIQQFLEKKIVSDSNSRTKQYELNYEFINYVIIVNKHLCNFFDSTMNKKMNI